MQVRLDKGGDHRGLTFDLVLIDGHEDGPYSTSVQLADSNDQTSVAYDFGFEGYDPTKDPHGEGEHGQAYDVLVAHCGKTIEDPGGYFDSIPYGPYSECEDCQGFHRLGYGGECEAERYVWDGSKMVRQPPG